MEMMPGQSSDGATASYGAINNGTTTTKVAPQSIKDDVKINNDKVPQQEDSANVVLVVIYGLINTIMTVPCMYGYASVIFSNPAFQNHINALSKLVLFSSVIHQISFSIFSTLPFSIGQVQDAGLIFLSAMSNIIANDITANGGTNEEVVSTTIVLLGMGTAALGAVLIGMGYFRLADAVGYLPLPVVGGYLAFIGYFCLEAGVGLCIDEEIMVMSDWKKLGLGDNWLLALPGVLAGGLMTWTSRNVANDVALPVVIVLVPVVFYIVIFVTGYGMERAREDGWIGEESPPVAAMDVIDLINFGSVKWSLIEDCIGTWASMVFVVAFSSCLDVAAISTDMGESLDTNNELKTVGISNFFSGMLGGFTGSYIFSQTIFTYRSGVKSRWIGIFLAAAELGVFFMTVNILEVTPLFFLGSTLIFIAVDLLYEWIVEVRHKLLFSEYLVLLLTFVSIQIFGIQSGIFIGIGTAGVDYIISTAQTSSLNIIRKRSRAVWNPDEWKLLQEKGYNTTHPKIVIYEIKGSVFFGSSMKLLTQLLDYIGLDSLSSQPEEIESLREKVAAPRYIKQLSRASTTSSMISINLAQLDLESSTRPLVRSKQLPDFVVLDMHDMSNLDASAARGCFLQLAKMCGKKDIVVCASGPNKRIDWTLRSHEVAYSLEEEDKVMDGMLGYGSSSGDGVSSRRTTTMVLEDAKILLFDSCNEALEFCESALLERIELEDMEVSSGTTSSLMMSRGIISETDEKASISEIFGKYIKLSKIDATLLNQVIDENEEEYYSEMSLENGENIFKQGDFSNSFFVVLQGSVAVYLDDYSYHTTSGGSSSSSNLSAPTRRSVILTGAGFVRHSRAVASTEPTTTTTTTTTAAAKKKKKTRRKSGAKSLKKLPVGSIFGYTDFILEQNRTFGAFAASDGETILAVFDHDGLDRLKDHPAMIRIVEKVLLQVSVRELNNAVEP